jgi:hypothetical protein
VAETPPNASPRPAVTPWRRPNLQLSHGGQQQQWPAASTVHGSGSSSGASSGSSSGAGSHRQRWVSEMMPRGRLITPAHAARGLGMLAAVARDRGSERGVTAWPEAGSRGHAPSGTNAEVKFSDVGGHIRGARHGRQQRLVGGPGGDPHLGGYLGRRPEGWQRRRGAQSQPRLRPTPAGRKSGSTLPPFDLRIIRLCMSSRDEGKAAGASEFCRAAGEICSAAEFSPAPGVTIFSPAVDCLSAVPGLCCLYKYK